MLAISARLAPFPPSNSLSVALPSATPPPNLYTYWVMHWSLFGLELWGFLLGRDWRLLPLNLGEISHIVHRSTNLCKQ